MWNAFQHEENQQLTVNVLSINSFRPTSLIEIRWGTLRTPVNSRMEQKTYYRILSVVLFESDLVHWILLPLWYVGYVVYLFGQAQWSGNLNFPFRGMKFELRVSILVSFLTFLQRFRICWVGVKFDLFLSEKIMFFVITVFSITLQIL